MKLAMPDFTTNRKMNQIFKKEERLCSFTAINDLVKNGVAQFHYPFRVVYQVKENCTEELHKEMESLQETDEPMMCSNAQETTDLIAGCNKILISVPKKNFKRAVKRNLLKRRIRESYRKNKALLNLPENTNVNFMLVYVSKDLLEYSYIERKLKEVLGKISENIKETRS